MKRRTAWLLAPLATVALATGLLAILLPLHLPALAAAASTEPPGDAPRYVGSAVCRGCHAQPYADLEKTGHGRMLAASGLPADLTGCEACHGPGGDHVGSTGKKPIGERLAGAEVERVEKLCGKCHLQEGRAAGAPGINPKHWQRTRHARRAVSCLFCHKVHGGVERSLTQASSQLCLGCHEEVLNRGGQYTHRPIADGKCLLCHAPHGSKQRHDLVDALSAACLACHRAEKADFTTAHSDYSVKASDCSSCHNPHSFNHSGKLLAEFQHQPFAARKCEVCHKQNSASGSPQLAKPQGELCRTCHPQQKMPPASETQGAVPSLHPPVAQGLCTTCHNPHATSYSSHLKDRADYVCFACHGQVEGEAASSYQHSPVTSGNCLLCHQGHVSAEAALLTKDSTDLCKGCHATQGRFTHPVGIWKGKPVRDPNTKQLITCARCHAVHGSRFADLLPREEDTLCRECHKK